MNLFMSELQEDDRGRRRPPERALAKGSEEIVIAWDYCGGAVKGRFGFFFISCVCFTFASDDKRMILRMINKMKSTLKCVCMYIST